MLLEFYFSCPACHLSQFNVALERFQPQVISGHKIFMGNIITFYSYQGGVGRTMALANVAVLLAQLPVLPPDGQPLSIKAEAEIDAALAAIAHTIADVISQSYLLNLSVLRSKRLAMKEKPENYRQKFNFRF